MPKKLDRSRGYGEVWGHENGAAFEQDGVLFDSEGVELFNEDAAPAAKPAAAKPKAAAPAKAKAAAATPPAASADDQLSKQLTEGGEGGLES